MWLIDALQKRYNEWSISVAIQMLVELRKELDEDIPKEYKPILLDRMKFYMDKLPEYQHLLEQYK